MSNNFFVKNVFANAGTHPYFFSGSRTRPFTHCYKSPSVRNIGGPIYGKSICSMSVSSTLMSSNIDPLHVRHLTFHTGKSFSDSFKWHVTFQFLDLPNTEQM